MPDGHSELEPPLPIPNRAVKRLSADDSADYPCESRTSSGTHKRNAPATSRGVFVCRPYNVLLERSDNTLAVISRNSCAPNSPLTYLVILSVVPACCGVG